MERALDPQLLEIALGRRTGLPTANELARLLGQAELHLLAGVGRMDDGLVATGWYLHAVASSRWALERYGSESQRAAFRVAAHVLDLALQTQELDQADRLRYCFAAQAAFMRCGLDPNAIAVYRREDVGAVVSIALEHQPELVALSCASAVLGMDLGRVLHFSRGLIDRSRDLAEQWDVESVTNTIFGAAALVAYGAYDLSVYLAYGHRRRMETAVEAFRRAVHHEAAMADRTSRWVAAHLAEITDHLGRASLWSALPPDTPVEVRRVFTAGQPRVVTLWPPQAEFFPKVGDDTRNPLDPSVRRLFLATPTSGGKTLLGQLLVAAHVARGQSGVCYVAPTRSLCHEIRTELDRRVRALGTTVLDDLPAFMPNVPQATSAAVEVMTPERLAHLLRTDADSVVARFGLFIFDEVHNVAEHGRGWTLESALAYLHHMTQGLEHRIVLISAVAGNQAHFVEWLGGADAHEVLHKHSTWRGPRRLHALWTTRPDWDAGTVRPSAGRERRREVYPITGRLHVRVTSETDIQHLEFREPVGQLVLRETRSGQRRRDSQGSTPAYRCLIPLIYHLSATGPTLVVESTRASAVRLARALVDVPRGDRLPPAPQDLIDLVDARLGADHPLSAVLRGGVAFHHGSLPSEVRTGIEEAVADSTLSCLVATTTMTEGVNLPVRAVVIASQGTFGVDGQYHEYIAGARLINAIGRAGRAAKETEGVVVLARPESYSAKDFDRIDASRVDATVLSSLATPEALQELAEFEALLREGQDAVLQVASLRVGGFLSFVWFVASRQEQLEGIAEIGQLQAWLSRTLAWVQLQPTDQARWLAAAQEGLRRYHGTPAESRMRWARAGTTLGSAAVLEAIAEEVWARLPAASAAMSARETITLVFGDGRLERLVALHEAPLAHIYTTRASGRAEVPVDLWSVLQDWLAGKELAELAVDHFSAVRDVDFRFEQLGDYINGYFETFLPWVLSVVVSWVNAKFGTGDDPSILSYESPAYVRWGVDDPVALQLMNEGVRSRALARAVALRFGQQGGGDVRAWLGGLGVAAWQTLFGASLADLRNLLEYAKPRGAGLLADVLNGRRIEVPIHAAGEVSEGARADLVVEGASPLSTVNVLVNGERIGTVTSRDQADMHTLIAAALPLDVTVIKAGHEWHVELIPRLEESDFHAAI